MIFIENKTVAKIIYVLSLKEKIRSFILANSIRASLSHLNYRYLEITAGYQILYKKKITIQDEFSPLEFKYFESLS
jgi:hypothetical protein